MTTSNLIKTSLFGVCSAVLATATARAAYINITVDSAGNLLNGSGVATKAQSGQRNNNPTSNFTFLNSEVSLWNAASDRDVLTPTGTVAFEQENFSGDSFTALTGFDYVVFHFGNGNAGGSPGGWWQAWYLGGAGGTFQVPTVGGERVGGFSSARYFGAVEAPPVAVPDRGATLALLGLGVVALLPLRKKMLPA